MLRKSWNICMFPLKNIFTGARQFCRRDSAINIRICILSQGDRRSYTCARECISARTTGRPKFFKRTSLAWRALPLRRETVHSQMLSTTKKKKQRPDELYIRRRPTCLSDFKRKSYHILVRVYLGLFILYEVFLKLSRVRDPFASGYLTNTVWWTYSKKKLSSVGTNLYAENTRGTLW